MFRTCYYVSSALFCSLVFHCAPCCTAFYFVTDCCLLGFVLISLRQIRDERELLRRIPSLFSFFGIHICPPFFSCYLSVFFPIAIPLSLSFHFVTSFIPLSRFLFSLLLCLSFFRSFLPLSSPICRIFDQLRQQEEINSHFFIIHTFSSSPAICPSATSDPASKWNCPSSPTRTGRHRAYKHQVCVPLSQLGVNNVPLCPSLFVHSVCLSQSAESIASLHLTVHSIRDNNGCTLD